VRYKLYQQGLVDREIADKVGVTPTAIAQWRYTRNLPANGGGCGFGNKSNGTANISMQKALTPEQCKDMNHFLSMLVKYDGIAREYGKTLDLGVFMKEYRGVLRERAG
jgi:hypothetical protein